MNNVSDAIWKLLGLLGIEKEGYFLLDDKGVSRITPTPTVQPQIKPIQPTVQPIRQPTATPTPTAMPNPSGFPLREEIASKYGQNYPYKELIQKTWPGVDPNQVANVIFGESSFQPTVFHVNKPNMSGWNDYQPSREKWKSVREQYPSVDVGLMQINTANAMTDYLASKGLTYYDLMSNPELNLQIANDLYSGRIPKTAGGWGNWYAAKSLKEKGYEY